MQLADRVVLRKGIFVDVRIFDPATVRHHASFARPHRFSEGIEYVLVGGNVVFENGRYDPTALAGKVIRRS